MGEIVVQPVLMLQVVVEEVVIFRIVVGEIVVQQVAMLTCVPGSRDAPRRETNHSSTLNSSDSDFVNA